MMQMRENYLSFYLISRVSNVPLLAESRDAVLIDQLANWD